MREHQLWKLRVNQQWRQYWTWSALLSVEVLLSVPMEFQLMMFWVGLNSSRLPKQALVLQAPESSICAET